jgi:hypothetical protein
MIHTLSGWVVAIVAVVVAATGVTTGIAFGRDLGADLGKVTLGIAHDAQRVTTNIKEGKPLASGLSLPEVTGPGSDLANRVPGVKGARTTSKDVGQAVRGANDVLGASEGHALSKAIKGTPHAIGQIPKLPSGAQQFLNFKPHPRGWTCTTLDVRLPPVCVPPNGR